MIKKITSFALLLAFSLFFSQRTENVEICASQQIKEEQLKDPKMKAFYDKMEADIQKELQRMNNDRVIVNGTDTIYEIPVVVHVIHSGEALGTAYNKSDDQIISWINDANEQFAATHPNFDAIGNGGTNMPIRLALAKRDPDCNSTSGILRINASTIPGYTDYGIRRNGTNGVPETDIRNLSRWNPNYYYNIYLINKFDGVDGSNGGLMGYAYFPFSGNVDGTYMVSAVVRTNSTTLSHELGHAINLDHTFGNANSQGGECPANADCTLDNDKICDTEWSQSLFSGPCRAATTINPCTGVAYAGVQYNVMNYTQCPRRFTPGQAARARAAIKTLRNSQVISQTSLEPSTEPAVTAIAPTCTPTASNNPNNNFNMGPTRVKLNTIDFYSDGATGESNAFYIDRSSESCYHSAYKTTIEVDTAYPMSITTRLNRQKVAAWIDYDNNGTFESTELVMSKFTGNVVNETVTANVTAPLTAVLNTPLRMRVVADFVSSPNPTACGNLSYGQVEDYVVTIVPKVNQSTNNVSNNVEFKIYPNPSKDGIFTIICANAKNAKVELIDASGRNINQYQVQNTDVNELKLQTNLPNGIYLIKVNINGKIYNDKLLINK